MAEFIDLVVAAVVDGGGCCGGAGGGLMQDLSLFMNSSVKRIRPWPHHFSFRHIMGFSKYVSE